MGAHGQVHEPVIVAIHGHKIAESVAESVCQGLAALQVSQSLFAHIESKYRRGFLLQIPHHLKEEQLPGLILIGAVEPQAVYLIQEPGCLFSVPIRWEKQWKSHHTGTGDNPACAFRYNR